MPHAYTYARTIRIADGPDEVHLRTVFGLELLKLKKKSEGL